MESLKLTLVTPLRKVFEEMEVSEIKFPADKGELTVYPDHSPLVTTLDTGVLSYKALGDADYTRAVITWGYCEIIDGKVKLLAETVQTVDMIDVDLARTQASEAEKALSTNTLEPKEIAKMQEQLKLANAQLQIATSV